MIQPSWKHRQQRVKRWVILGQKEIQHTRNIVKQKNAFSFCNFKRCLVNLSLSRKFKVTKWFILNWLKCSYSPQWLIRRQGDEIENSLNFTKYAINARDETLRMLDWSTNGFVKIIGASILAITLNLGWCDLAVI